MFPRVRLILKYFQYLFIAKTKHGVHSPFVYDLLTNVILDDRSFYSYESIENYRRALYLDKRMVEVTDFGAGSQKNNNKKKTVAQIAKHAAKPAKYGQLLFRLAAYFKPTNMLELGTSLGISSAYQGLAFSNGRLTTMEGCPQTAEIAAENLKKLNVKNVKIVTGNFDLTLPQLLSDTSHLDYVFFDGNHQKEPTIRYFEKCLAKAHPNSLFVLDDIHWSDGMEQAWTYIKQHPKTTVTIDLFFIGLVFFRPQQAKEHFILRY